MREVYARGHERDLVGVVAYIVVLVMLAEVRSAVFQCM